MNQDEQKELTLNLMVLLQEADWFKQMVKEAVFEEVSAKDIEDSAANAAAKIVQKNFDIGDYSNEIDDLIDGKLEGIDYEKEVKKVLLELAR